jgi:hypothetical protein
VLTLGKIDELIKLNETHSDEMHEARKHKDVYSDPFDKEVKRLKTLKVLVESGVRFKLDDSGGAVVVEDQYVFTLISHKWRVVGKNVWYKSKGVSDFLTRFVKV